MDIYRAAVRYVALGWSVIPLIPNSKKPLIAWQELQKRLPTSEELKDWFQGTQNNIGIVTGKISNLSVVDVDEAKNLVQGVCSAITVLTKRGKHLYFSYSEERNSASKIAEHIDVRGEGGFVVAPGSVVDGFRYRFVNPVINPGSLTPFPKQLLGEAKANVQSKSPDWISEALNGLAEGSRHRIFAQVVGRLHYDGHFADTIYTLLAPHAERVSFSGDELTKVINSILKYENKNEKRETMEAEHIEKFLEGEETVEWIVPSLIARSSIGFCAGLPESLKTWILIDLAIEVARGGNWLGMEVNKARVLFVDQERFVGETRRRFKRMIKGKNIVLDENLNSNLVIQVGSSVRLNLDVSFESFRKKLQEIRPDLIIVDSFATFSTVAENDRQEVQKVLERVKQIRQEFGCTVLFIDHEGKGVLSSDNAGRTPDAYGMIGSVAKPAAAELVLTARKESNSSVVLYNTKNSLAQAIAPIAIQIVDTPNEGIKLEKI